MSTSPIQIFSTCAQSADHEPGEFVDQVAQVARWSEAAGCTGMLIYTDNRLADAWLVGQVAIQQTEHLCPLIAVQPAYMHPYTVANMVASYGFLHGRRIFMNLVAGGFKNDLTALDDDTPHDRRYDRLVEYTQIVMGLLRGSAAGEAFDFDGEFYRVKNLKLTPALDPALLPGVFLSGSSEAGMRAVDALGATGIQYPKPVDSYEAPLSVGVGGLGMRIGVIARPTAEEAWAVAEDRFPEDRKGQLTRQLATKTSDSEWHKQLAGLGEGGAEDNPYWMRPFDNYKSMCPYLVGDYERVGSEVARYIALGYETFILDIPPDEEELTHTGAAFQRAQTLAAA